MNKFILGVILSIFLISCEEKIDVDLNTASPKTVIEADLNNLSNIQEIRVSKTVSFDESKPFEPIDDAVVIVASSEGKVFNFHSVGDGRYVNNNMQLTHNQEYGLLVTVDGENYTALTSMPTYIEVDSLGITKENIFNEDYYFVNLNFKDPVSTENYYKYNVGVGGNRIQFNSVFSDKFNDGLVVKHQIGGRNFDFNNGDKITIRRYCIAKDVYKYWSEYQSTNPGSAAPGNPTSNISNEALGYFSVSSAKEYAVQIVDDEVKE